MNYFLLKVSPANAMNFAIGEDIKILHYIVDINKIMKLEIPWWSWCLYMNREGRTFLRHLKTQKI